MRTADKIVSALSLCKKAGKLVVGFDAVCDSLLSGQAQLLLFANDVSPKTSKKAIGKNVNDIPVEILPVTMQQIATITFKPVGVLAVEDENFAALCQGAIQKTLSQLHEEETI